MKVLIITLIVIGLFLVTGCGASETPSGPGPVTDAKDILGVWDIIGEGYYQYNEDGSFSYAGSRESLTERPSAVGEFWFEEGQYFENEIEVHNVPSCGSTIGIYDLQRLENGNLKFSRVEDECGARATAKIGEYKRVE